MSGWQRLGVVISVLWFVGLPIYVLVDTNRRAIDYQSDCIIIRMRADPPRGSDAERAAALQRIEDVCQELSGHMTWGEMFRFFADNKDMWAILLGPIILLWLVGAIVLGTVRWVRRGFTGAGR